jgi:predicted amino acid dehydrogenase
MTKEQILGIIRHALTFAGGVLITKGIIDSATFAELSGAALTLIGGIWSVVAKNK